MLFKKICIGSFIKLFQNNFLIGKAIPIKPYPRQLKFAARMHVDEISFRARRRGSGTLVRPVQGLREGPLPNLTIPADTVHQVEGPFPCTMLQQVLQGGFEILYPNCCASLQWLHGMGTPGRLSLCAYCLPVFSPGTERFQPVLHGTAFKARQTYPLKLSNRRASLVSCVQVFARYLFCSCCEAWCPHVVRARVHQQVDTCHTRPQPPHFRVPERRGGRLHGVCRVRVARSI
jgi:hypothetical protein